jgi:hypothetical protein
MFGDFLPIIILVCAKNTKQYLKKNLMENINEDEYVVMTTFIMFICLIVYYSIKYHILVCNGNSSLEQLSNLPNKYLQLNSYNKFIMIILSIITIITLLCNLKLDQSKNNSTNTILIKVIGPLITVLISAYTNQNQLANNQITPKIFIGYIIVFIGLLMIG